MIVKYVGFGKPIFSKLNLRPDEMKKLYPNISKARRILNWRPKISIEEGISELIKNISYWKNAPLWTKKTIKD